MRVCISGLTWGIIFDFVFNSIYNENVMDDRCMLQKFMNLIR